MQTTPRNLWHVLCGVALVSAMVLSGCQSADRVSSPPASTAPVATSAAPASSAAPTPTATPTPSRLVVTAKPTTPEETAALVAEAEHVYREHQRLIDQYEAQGGAADLPEPLKQYVGGEYAEAVESSLKYTKDSGDRFWGNTSVKRRSAFTEVMFSNSLIGVEFCNDLTTREAAAKDGPRHRIKAWIINRAEFSRGTDGKLRIMDNISEEAASCE